MDIPNMRTWIDDEIVTPQMLNEQVRDAGNFNLARPGAYVTIPNSFSAAVSGTYIPSYTTIKYNTDDMVDFSSMPNGLVVNTPGLYYASFQFEIQLPGATNNRGNFWMVHTFAGGGDVRVGQFQFTGNFSANAVAASVSGFEYMNAGDTIDGRMIIAGASGTATFGADTPISLGAVWLGS